MDNGGRREGRGDGGGRGWEGDDGPATDDADLGIDQNDGGGTGAGAESGGCQQKLEKYRGTGRGGLLALDCVVFFFFH